MVVISRQEWRGIKDMSLQPNFLGMFSQRGNLINNRAKRIHKLNFFWTFTRAEPRMKSTWRSTILRKNAALNGRFLHFCIIPAWTNHGLWRRDKWRFAFWKQLTTNPGNIMEHPLVTSHAWFGHGRSWATFCTHVARQKRLRTISYAVFVVSTTGQGLGLESWLVSGLDHWTMHVYHEVIHHWTCDAFGKSY